MIDIDQLEKLARAATGGPWQTQEPLANSDPWRVIGDIDQNFEGDGTVHTNICEIADHSAEREDAEFIAECRESVPDLIEEIRKWRASGWQEVRDDNLPPPRQKVLATDGVNIWFDQHDQNFPGPKWCGWNAAGTLFQPRMPDYWRPIGDLPEPRF